MLAGARNVAVGAAILMAGLLAVMAANRVWIALFRLETLILFHEADFDFWPYVVSKASGYTESLIGAVMIWLAGRMVRRASKSTAAGR